MFIRFVTTRTVTSRRSGCSRSRFSLRAARSRSFTRCFSRTRLTERIPASMPENRNEIRRKQTISSPDHFLRLLIHCIVI